MCHCNCDACIGLMGNPNPRLLNIYKSQIDYLRINVMIQETQNLVDLVNLRYR
jgi:hypothetical protein